MIYEFPGVYILRKKKRPHQASPVVLVFMGFVFRSFACIQPIDETSITLFQQSSFFDWRQFFTITSTGGHCLFRIVPGSAVGAEAAMGKHWLPPPPSFLPFSHVMILGTYNGHFNFIEPMVTINYLQSGQSASRDYAQPQKFEKEGNYPTKYNVWKDENTGHHFVSLSHFVWRNAN